MSKRWLWGACVVLGLALAAPAAAKGGGERQEVKAHLELGEYDLRGERYEAALEHFEAVLALAPSLKPGKKGKKAPAAEVEEGLEGGAAAESPEKRLAQVKFRAMMGAAASLWRLGKGAEAEERAGAALALARAEGLTRAERVAERFLDDPQEAVLRGAPTARELEAFLKERAEAR
jgi:tetratricopeptide (TPR) repeat protein